MGRRPSNRASGYQRNELDPIAGGILFLVAAIIFIYIFIIKPIIAWASQHIPLLITIASIIAILIMWAIWAYLKSEKAREKAERAFEKAQKEKGLIKFEDHKGEVRWGTPSEAEKETLFNKVVESIRNFQPSRRYHNEFGYHTELQGWIKSHFSNAKPELQTGASRPDIVIADIAIEVKGPTDNQALNTLTTKCLKYSHYYKHLVLVLFEPRFSERNYDEIVRGIKKHFPHVKIIRK